MNVTRQLTSALVVARPGNLLDGLIALLEAIPAIERIHQANSGAAALALTTNLHPTLVLLDFDLPDGDLVETLRQIKRAQAQTKCVVLVDSRMEQSFGEAAGADAVLVKGGPAQTLIAVVEDCTRGSADASGNHE